MSVPPRPLRQNNVSSGIDDLTAHNAVVIPLSNGHSHTEFLHMRGYNYRSRKPYEVYGKFRDAVDWKDSDEDRRAFAITPRPQLRIGDAILFNTQHVHRGPCNNTKDWRIVLFMHWPVGIHAAVKRQNELDRLNATDTRFGRTEQESISSVITLDMMCISVWN